MQILQSYQTIKKMLHQKHQVHHEFHNKQERLHFLQTSTSYQLNTNINDTNFNITHKLTCNIVNTTGSISSISLSLTPNQATSVALSNKKALFLFMTHGMIDLMVTPLILSAILQIFDLTFLGILTHPVF